MKAIRTNETNAVLGVSPGQAAAGVKPLPYRRAPGEVASHWILTEADLDALVKNGGIVTLVVWADTHPPLSLCVEPDLKVAVKLDEPDRIADA